jgi:hypothetical protein
VTWLQDLWEALEGARPPATLEVIVAGEPGAWAAEPAADSPEGRRWHALRLTLLYHIWAARCSADSAQRSAHAVTRATVAALRADIRLQYNRQHCAQQQQRHLPARQLAMRRLQPERACFDVWEHPLLARLGAHPPATAGPQPPLTHPRPRPLELLLDVDNPVPIPAAPAAAS